MPVVVPSGPGGVLPALADVSDVEAGWRVLSEDERARAAVLIERASARLRALAPRVDDRLASGALSPVLVAAGIADLVAGVLQRPDSGVDSRTEQVGPFSETVRWTAGSGGGPASFPADFLALVRGGGAARVGTLRVALDVPWR